MFNNLTKYLKSYLGEPSDRPTRTSNTAAPERTHPSSNNDSDDDSWLLVDAGDENEESYGSRLVRLSRSASTSSLPCQSMEESWFVTPPPCFTSTAPSGLETNPLENLLIEHPSMSVYHGQGRTRSASPLSSRGASPLPPPIDHHPHEVRMPLEPMTNRQRLRYFECYIGTKNDTKHLVQMSGHQLERSNKVREVNSRSRRQRRSDRQNKHSGANNNRKCC